MHSAIPHAEFNDRGHSYAVTVSITQQALAGVQAPSLARVQQQEKTPPALIAFSPRDASPMQTVRVGCSTLIPRSMLHLCITTYSGLHITALGSLALRTALWLSTDHVMGGHTLRFCST